MLPSLNSITTCPPPRVSRLSPGLRAKPRVKANGAVPFPLDSMARPVTLVARASVTPCARTMPANSTNATRQRKLADALTRDQATFPDSPPPHRLPPRPPDLRRPAVYSGRSGAGQYGDQGLRRQPRGGGSTGFPQV